MWKLRSLSLGEGKFIISSTQICTPPPYKNVWVSVRWNKWITTYFFVTKSLVNASWNHHIPINSYLKFLIWIWWILESRDYFSWKNKIVGETIYVVKCIKCGCTIEFSNFLVSIDSKDKKGATSTLRPIIGWFLDEFTPRTGGERFWQSSIE